MSLRGGVGARTKSSERLFLTTPQRQEESKLLITQMLVFMIQPAVRMSHRLGSK